MVIPREEILAKYDPRVFKNRKEHIITVDSNDPNSQITANSRAVPGIMTHRGCCYAGCKGVVLGPLKDVLVITHGPIGCGFYSWGTRRNKAYDPNGVWFQYCFSTDVQEPDIVFGGDKKLRKAIDEALATFKVRPKAIMICSTCPIGLIGDDIHAVAAKAEADYGIPCMAFSCEGYKGVSQSGGHHIANNTIMRRVIGSNIEAPQASRYSVNLLGEYNIGGDGWEVERILERCGIEVVSIFTGDGSFEKIQKAHTATLNLVQCHRSINYIAEMMKTKYGIDWLKVNFIGIKSTIKSLHDIADYFDDPVLTKRIEEVIEDEMEDIADDIVYLRSMLEGKTAVIYVGGSRSHHYQLLMRDFGIKCVAAGYEFAHRDDYEGRDVIPTIKGDADNKNIESITVKPDPDLYKTFLTEARYKELKEKMELDDYAGMIPDMDNGSIVIDDMNEFESEEIMRIFKPDMFFSGIKDKYMFEKSGVYSRQLHSYDYSGPYSGFAGACKFGHDLVMGLTIPAWKLIVPKWKKESVLEASFEKKGVL